MERWISFLGLLTMLFLAWCLSENRRKMNWRLIISGVLLQLALALLLLKTPLQTYAFHGVAAVMNGFIESSNAGAEFVFGKNFQDHYVAFVVMSTVILFSSLTAVLFYLGILQWIIKVMARVMVYVMDASGSESLCTAANVFVGTTTAPLAIRPYLASMTRSELMVMMTGGMATVSGGTMVAYVGIAQSFGVPASCIAGHLAVASLISAPAAIVVAKMMVPETEESVTKGHVTLDVPRTDANLIDAACRGAGEGLKLVLNIVAMLIAFIALVHMVNLLLEQCTRGIGWLCYFSGSDFRVEALLGGNKLTLQLVLGWLCAPLAWIIGVEWKDARIVGQVVAERTVFNEFIGYASLMQHAPVYDSAGALIAEPGKISPRSFTIATYALCTFANFGSIAVMIGGIGVLEPGRRPDLAHYGFRSLIAGSLAAFMTAAIAGMLL